MVIAYGVVDGGKGACGQLAYLGYRSTIHHVLNPGPQLRQEGAAFNGDVDEFGQVFRYNNDLAQDLPSGGRDIKACSKKSVISTSMGDVKTAMKVIA